ncbi:hypothetical protein V8J88_18030 [Massilia sp. W12]|uniref:hypothetical protein n=1 Tax=Massilia sp. W12 TaxID=3126507 RepID=UPI0030D008CF
MIYEIRNDGINKYAVLAGDYSVDPLGQLFETNGSPLQWPAPPFVQTILKHRKKTKSPRADFSHLWFGSIVLSQRAYLLLHEFLAPFGQLLELNCEGEPEFFYNVTKLLPCIDQEHSEFDEYQLVKRPAFFSEFDQEVPLIFKDALTARICIYINQVAKEKLEKIVQEHALTGIKFSIPGSSPY